MDKSWVHRKLICSAWLTFVLCLSWSEAILSVFMGIPWLNPFLSFTLLVFFCVPCMRVAWSIEPIMNIYSTVAEKKQERWGSLIWWGHKLAWRVCKLDWSMLVHYGCPLLPPLGSRELYYLPKRSLVVSTYYSARRKCLCFLLPLRVVTFFMGFLYWYHL